MGESFEFYQEQTRNAYLKIKNVTALQLSVFSVNKIMDPYIFHVKQIARLWDVDIQKSVEKFLDNINQ